MMNAWENVLWGHFAALPKILESPVCENGIIKTINCGLNTSMFNIAYGCLSSEQNSLETEIDRVISYFSGQQFAWWVPNSNEHSQFIKRLEEFGFVRETDEIAMQCDLTKTAQYVPKTKLSVQPVQDRSTLQDFISILEPYDPKARSFFEGIPFDLLAQSNEVLCVGSIDHQPVVIGSVFENGESAGIFNVVTREESRGNGYGTDLMGYLMKYIKKRGQKYAMLLASSDSGFRIYERLGFIPFGHLDCLEYKGH